MSQLTFHWFLPTNGGDGRHIVGGGHGVTRRRRRPPGDACPTSGRSPAAPSNSASRGRSRPTGAWCEDAWITTAMLSSVSERLKFLVAFRPGLTSPFLAAQMAGTFQNLSGGRLLLNVVTGGESHEQRMYGDFLDKDGRYERCGEFLDIVTRAVERRDGRLRAASTYRVENAVLDAAPDPLPEIYFGGSSPRPRSTSPRSTSTST